MKIIDTYLNEIFLFKSDLHVDKRGFFSEYFVSKSFEKEVGKKIHFCQENITYSKKGVLRGLHYQLSPHSQTKLVSVLKGSVLDIIVDIRKGSPTFGQHVSQELSEDNKFQLFVPRGFAHGYITLSEDSIFQYKVDNYYYPESEASIAADDPSLEIDWIISKEYWIQSDKDQKHPMLEDAVLFDYNDDLYA